MIEKNENLKEIKSDSDYYLFTILLQKMGFIENKVPMAEDLGNYEFMAQKDNGNILVSLMTNMGWTMFKFNSKGKHINF